MNTRTVKLTPREYNVLLLGSLGDTIPDMARKLRLSETTCKSHLSRAYEKLGAKNRGHAVRLCYELGFLHNGQTAGVLARDMPDTGHPPGCFSGRGCICPAGRQGRQP